MGTPVRLHTIVIRFFLFGVLCALVALVTLKGYEVYMLYFQSLNTVPGSTHNESTSTTTLVAETNMTEEEKLVQGRDFLNTQLPTFGDSLPDALKNELEESRLYFMLAHKEGTSTQSFVFENGAFMQSPHMRVQDLFYTYSQDGSKIGYFAIAPEKKTDGIDWALQAQGYVTTNIRGSGSAFPAFELAELVDSTVIGNKQYPSVSNAGDLLFVALQEAFHVHEDGFERADDYEIYYATKGKTKLLLNGFMPKWINDTEFIFLKNDGLYKANVSLTSVERIYQTEESQMVLLNNSIDVSHDGSMIVWTRPNQEEVFLLAKNQQERFELIGVIPERGFNVAFSPGGTYLALLTRAQEPNEDEHDGPTKKLEFFDIATLERVQEFQIRFDAFNQHAVFFTEWTSK